MKRIHGLSMAFALACVPTLALAQAQTQPYDDQGYDDSVDAQAQQYDDQLDDDDRYADPGLAAQPNPGEISGEALARLHAMVVERMLDRDAFAAWFGRYITAPKNPEIDWRPEQPIDLATLRARIAAASPLLRNPASRFSFIPGEGGGLTLFVDGNAHDCVDPAADVARQLCASDRLVVDREVPGSEAGLALLTELLNQGSVAFEPAA